MAAYPVEHVHMVEKRAPSDRARAMKLMKKYAELQEEIKKHGHKMRDDTHLQEHFTMLNEMKRDLYHWYSEEDVPGQ